MNRKILLGVAGLIGAFALFFFVNVLSRTALRTVRADLTDGKLYTLTAGTRNIVRSLPEPVTLRFYYSEKLSRAYPDFSTYGTRIRELLQEYADLSGGKLRLEVIDPEPDTDTEEEAILSGMKGTPTPAGNLFLGLEGRDSTNLRRSIPFLTPQREAFLEYDISSLIHQLANPEKRTITIVTGLNVAGKQADPMARAMGQAQDTPPWVFVQMLQETHNVQFAALDTTEIPAGTDLLMLFHPKELTERMRYAVDQYALRGGKLIVVVDPHSEVEAASDTTNQGFQALTIERSSTMQKLFDAWGIAYDPKQVLADRDRASQVMAGSQSRPEIVQYVLYLTLRSEDLNRKDVVSSQLNVISAATAGAISLKDGAKVTLDPLLQSSRNAMLVEAEKARMFPDPKKLLEDFKSLDKQQVVAARVTGNVTSAWPDGPPESVAGAREHLNESSTPLNAVIIADTDLFSDRLWVRLQNIFGTIVASPTSDNGSLIANLADNLSGSSDLISIRGRGEYRRPFTVVEDLMKKAEERFAGKQKELQEQLAQTEQRLAQLQQASADGQSDALILSQEQRAEIEKFQQERVRVRRELRDVRRDLRRDIESLDARLKFYNILLVPILVGMVAVGVGAYRARRRRR